MTELLSEFHSAYPPAGEREAFDPARHGGAAQNVPAPVADEWHKLGFGAYGDGLLWTIAPDKPVLNRRDWPFLDGTGTEILRSAFASVCVWQGGIFLWLNVHTGKITKFDTPPDLFFDYVLIEAGFRKDALRERLFRRANEKLGKLGPDECFGFAPLPALGGAIKEEFLIKTNVREYVALAGHVLQN